MTNKNTSSKPKLNVVPPDDIDAQIEHQEQAQEQAQGKVKSLSIYSSAINYLNKSHAVVMLGGKCCVLNETIDPEFNRQDITFSAKSDLVNYYANQRVPDPDNSKRDMSIADYWWTSPRRRQYKGIVFEPGRDVPGYYNLYQGFAVEPKKGDWSLYKNLIYDIIADGKPDRAKWILAWLARIIQDPGGERPGTSIVMQGKMGTGKGVFCNTFGSLFGKHYLQLSQASQVTGNFNSHLKDSIVVFVDEGFWAGNKQAEGVIKNMVTEPYINIEPKNKDIFRVKNNVNLLIASNNDWVVPAGLEERRFLVLGISEAKLQDHKYFKAICDQMNNGGREALLYDLLRMDISDVNLRKIERTDELLNQIINSMTPIQKYWFDRLSDGTILPTDNEWKDKVLSCEQHNDFVQYCHNQGYSKHILSEKQFGRQLAQICKGIIRKRKADILSGGRPYYRFFPSLEECRKQFEQLINIPGYKWEYEDTVPF